MEIMVAISMTAAIGLMIAIAFSSSFKSKELIEADADRYRALRTAMSRMEREIAASFVSDHYDATRYRDQNDRPTNFIGTKNHLLFTSLAHQRLYTDAKESDQMVVEYSVKASPDRKARDRNDLIRRQNPNLDEKMDKGGTEDILFEGAKQIEFSYWDSDKKDWADEWDTRQLARKANLPSRVRITLTAKDENGKDQKYMTQTRIMLNTELPRF